MTDYTLKSGKEISVCFAGFELASKLRRAIEKTLMSVEIDISSLEGKDLLKTEISSDLINNFKNAIFAIDSSEEIEALLFKCLERCKYDHEKITKQLFNDEDNVSDYYEIAWRCIEKNLTPFFKNLLTNLEQLTQIVDNIPSSSSQETKS